MAEIKEFYKIYVLGHITLFLIYILKSQEQNKFYSYKQYSLFYCKQQLKPINPQRQQVIIFSVNIPPSNKMNSLHSCPSTSSSTTIPFSTSHFPASKISPSTLQQAISQLRKQLRQSKIQLQQQSQSHSQQVGKYVKQIEALKKKILFMSEKEYLKSVLTEDFEEEKIKQATLDNTYKKMKLYVEKLEADVGEKNLQIQWLQENQLDMKKDLEMMGKQKEKHLQLSIVQKINLEDRIHILQKEITSKQSIILAIKSQSSQSTNKQIKLKKLERRLIKKLNQVEQYQAEAKNLKSFEHQKLKKRIESLQKQNDFLKQHIQKIQTQFNQTNQCACFNKECKEQIDLFKNKYINKSRELSKVKVQLSKEIFKEQFLKEIKSRENISSQPYKKSLQKSRTDKKYSYIQEHHKINSVQGRKTDSNEDILFKLTENDQQQNYGNQNTPPSYSDSKIRANRPKFSSKPLKY